MSLFKSSLGRRLTLAAALLFSTQFGAYAQTATPGCDNPPDCIVNPELTADGTSGGDMNTVPGGNYVNGWSVSHGSPSIWSPHSAPNAVWMWSYSGRGEGIYSCFNFQSGHTYRICMWVMNTNVISGGNLNIFAATGLAPNYGSTTVPTPATSELISNSYTWNTVGSWSQVSYTYTPNDDYSQLWIYPFRSLPPDSFRQYELAVDDIHVFEIPNPEEPIVVCTGDPLTLPGAACGSYRWYDPSNNYLGVGPVNIPNATPSMSGPYTLIYGEGDCRGEMRVEVIVKDCKPCDDFKADFKFKGCNPVSFSDVSTGPGSSVGWFWDFGDGTSSNLANPVHNYASAGVYRVCLTVIRRAGGRTCCKQICYEVKVCKPQPGEDPHDNESSFRYELMNGNGRTLRFQDAVVGNDVICDYQWDFGDGAVSSLPNPAHSYSQGGNYVVTLKVTSCGSDVNGELVKGFTNTYRRQVQVAGAAGKPEMMVMPNPANDQATVQVKNMGSARVTLRDLYGKKVATGSDNGNGGFSLSLQHLAPGVYTVIVDGDKGQYVQKLVKK